MPVIIPTSMKVEPTERSTSPIDRTNTAPMVIMPTYDAWRVTSSRLKGFIKVSVVIANARQSMKKAARTPISSLRRSPLTGPVNV